MDEVEAYDLARITMDLHGLAHWELRIDNAKGRLGNCNYTHRRLSFSRHFLKANPPAVFVDTLMHEIAHALVDPIEESGHGEIWKAKAMELGIEDPMAGAWDVEFPDEEYRYAGDCRGDHEHTDVFRRHRINRKTIFRCNTCGNRIVWYDRKLGDEF